MRKRPRNIECFTLKTRNEQNTPKSRKEAHAETRRFYDMSALPNYRPKAGADAHEVAARPIMECRSRFLYFYKSRRINVIVGTQDLNRAHADFGGGTKSPTVTNRIGVLFGKSHNLFMRSFAAN